MIRRRYWLLAVAAAVTLALWPFAAQSRYDRSIRSFFDPNNLQYCTYNRVQEEFGGDTLCLAVYTDAAVLTPEGIRKLEEFTKRLGRQPGILKVQSLAQLPRPGAAVGTIARVFANARTDKEALKAEILAADVYRNQFVDESGCTAVAALLVDPDSIASGQFTETLKELRRECDALGGHVVGAPVMINDVYDYLEQDAWILTNVCTAAMAAVILALFRRLRWMLLPMGVVQVSLIWTNAVMYACDIQLSLTAALTTAMVTVIGITASIHLAVRFREESRRRDDVEEALHATLTHVLPPVFWACATTAAGFGALGASRVLPVRSFGLLMAAASMIVFATVCLLVPAGVLVGRSWLGVVPRSSLGERHLSEGLHWIVSFVGRHAWLTSFAALTVLGVAMLGFQWIGVETNFTKNFKRNSIVVQGYEYVESRLGAAGLVDVVVDAPPDLNEDFQERVRSCQERLRGIPGVEKATSLVDLLDLMKASRVTLLGLRLTQPPEVKQFWNAKTERFRIVLRVREQQSTCDKDRVLREIDETVRTSFGPRAEVTGLYLLLVHLIDSLLADQWTSLALSATGILLMMTLAFRSLRMGVVAFLPNLVPIAVTVGLMGWVGLKISVATAMIQSISMGMAVDFSIHYLHRYRLERRRGLGFYPALDATHRSTGQAMVFAECALILGFGILTLSNFVPTIHFGLLVSLAMVGGLVGNLVVLPVLLRVVYRVGPPRLEEEEALERALRSS